jgi:hypothetical protein
MSIDSPGCHGEGAGTEPIPEWDAPEVEWARWLLHLCTLPGMELSSPAPMRFRQAALERGNQDVLLLPSI